MRSIIDDRGDAYEHWCDEQLEQHGRNASFHAGSSAKRKHDGSGSSRGDAMRLPERQIRAQAAGRPPRREDYASASRFRAARSQWYRRFTGDSLEQCGGLAIQQDAFDAVARRWRAYSDGRRSLSASQWDGRLTPAERHMNSM